LYCQYASSSERRASEVCDNGDTGDAGDSGDIGDFGDFGDLGDSGDLVAYGCPPPNGFCPPPPWWRGQHGNVAIRNVNGTYYLPDGSVWIGTEAEYYANTNILQGYTYLGDNGSQWFAGANFAAYPETLQQLAANQNSLFQQIWQMNCGRNYT
jgi:hypothetical protein